MLLLYLHVAAACIHLISCVMSIVVHIDSGSAITLASHEYHVDPVSTTTTYETLLEQSPMVWISGNEALTFFSHLIAVFYLARSDEMRSYESLRRTIEYSFTAGILQVALVLSAGSITLPDMFFILLINGVMQFMILGMNKENRTLLMTCGFVLLAAEIQFVILNSMRLSGISLDYFVLTGVMYALFYIGFGVLKLFDTEYEDEIYILMSVSSKVALSWLLIGNVFEGYKELGETTNPDFTDLDWRAIQWIVVLFSIAVLVIGIPLILGSKPYKGKKDRKDRLLKRAGELTEMANNMAYSNLRY